MRRGRPWVMIVVGLAACFSSRMSEEDVDAARGADSECVTSQGTGSCVEGAASEEAGSARSDAGVTGPRHDGGCEYLSQHFEDDVSFPSNDGINSCQCFSGSTSCTQAFSLGRPAHCDLPFEPGTCDESHAYYWHNPSTNQCEAKQYSGCGGNLNRFEEYGDCAYRCSLSNGPGQDCAYEGQTYHHRQRVVRRPSEMTGCGPCLCNDGRVLCPPAGCECPEGQKLGLQCAGCGSAGGCSDVEERCFPTCDTDADCDSRHGVFCDEAQAVCVSTPACL